MLFRSAGKYRLKLCVRFLESVISALLLADVGEGGQHGGAGLRRVALDRLASANAPDLYVFGHSHAEALERAPDGGVLANPGAWLDAPRCLRIDATSIAVAELRDGALMAGRAFNLNVTLNKHHEITGVFAGDLLTSHRTGCAFVRETAMQAVARPFDVVVTTNSGYPLDLNVYQAIKGISAAARVCRDGGAIVAAAECWDGIPDHGEYRRLLEEGANPEAIVERVAAHCATGQQAYWVCPLIEESEVVDSQAATELERELSAALPRVRIGLVHGRMKPAEKDAVMRAFKAAQLDLLVATTVIEVGVDVPNATLMVVENAERMGLAQLHQLRGRVGRGRQASTCVLLYKPPLSLLARERLNVLRNTNDGFEVAQKDLQLRGPGEVLGTRQTGLMAFRIADLVRDSNTVPSQAMAGGKVTQLVA